MASKSIIMRFTIVQWSVDTSNHSLFFDMASYLAFILWPVPMLVVKENTGHMMVDTFAD